MKKGKKGDEEKPKQRDTPTKGAQAGQSQAEEYYEKIKKNPPKTASELASRLLTLALQDPRFRNQKENKGRLLFGMFSAVWEKLQRDGFNVQDDIKDLLKSKEGLEKFVDLFKDAESAGRKHVHGFSKRTLFESLIGFLKEYDKEGQIPYDFLLRYDGQRWWLMMRKKPQLNVEESIEEVPPPSPSFTSSSKEEEDYPQVKEDQEEERSFDFERLNLEKGSTEKDKRSFDFEQFDFKKGSSERLTKLDRYSELKDYIKRIDPPEPTIMPPLQL